MKRLIVFLPKALLHLGAIVVIVYAFWPMARWYLEARPFWGVDFFYTASLVNLLRDNFVFPPTGWGYAWFTGWPLLSNYPILHLYLILPLTRFFGLLSSVEIWMVVSLGLFFLGSYAVFYQLCRNYVISGLLSIATVYSVGVYGALMWGGSLPNQATQAFFPWVIFFINAYLKKRESRFLLLASLLAGLAILSHPQIVIVYIYPAVAILFLFSFGMRFADRFKSLLAFLAISALVGLPLFYSSLGAALKVLVLLGNLELASSTARIPSTEAQAIAAFHRAQPLRIYIDTNTTIFFLLAVAAISFLVTLMFKREKRLLFSILPFLVLAVYFTIYIWIFSFGISVYHGGWYRLFWAVPFWLGMLLSSLWGTAQEILEEKLLRLGFYFKKIVLLLINVLFLATGSFLLVYFSQDIRDKIIARSNPSSAFPDVLNLRTDRSGFESLKKEMVPEWLDANQTNFRLYSGDQTVNIWWNSLYAMPLARGYFDPPVSERNRGYFFWLDAALNVTPAVHPEPATGENQLAGSFGYPNEIAFNNTLFLVDWYAVKFFEAGHLGPTTYAPLPERLTSEQFMANHSILEFNKEKYNKGNQTLNYYKLKDEFVTPILSATKAKTLGIVASDEGYETVVRAIADANLASKSLTPIKLGNYLDQLSASDLSSMDALLIYDYRYKNKNKAFGLVSDYVKKGKKVFIDTGVEVKESEDAGSLPDIFPIEKTFRKPLGSTWDLEIFESDLTLGIDFSQFDPPMFDDDQWKFSFPQGESDVRSETEIILKNHGIPLMISRRLQEGEVLWSGLNLPYHVSRFHNSQEVAFFKNILEELLLDTSQMIEPTYKTTFVSSQQRKITISAGTGVLFKEQAYPGWQASVRSEGKSQKLKIYKAGPAYPGFMYIRIPPEFKQEAIVTFIYRGSGISWFLTLLSFLIGLVILDEVILGGRVLGKVRQGIWRRVHARVKGWWGREDE